ncbi:FAD-dependent monooxygenase [Thioalkalivibrio sp. HK1]|uniref:FAD-dependent monooxygenase n=1 Tax=Thioalkalivibrio sp. HK1 TaxID=1469245 RepID=UPI00046FB95C|nr:FAD-dependent monooxygenase [Thioalkalivibrio sp. HK1]
MNRNDPVEHYDVAIAGGGAIGAVLACALADGGAKALLVDPSFSLAAKTCNESDPETGSAGASTRDRRAPDRSGSFAPGAFTPRPLALSLASWRMLEALDIEKSLTERATPIRSIHISEAGRFGAARLEAGRFDLECFGKVIDAASLGQALDKALGRRDLSPGVQRRSVDSKSSGGVHRIGGRIEGACPLAHGIAPHVVFPNAIGQDPPSIPRSLSHPPPGTRPTPPSERADTPFVASLLAIADGGRSGLRQSLGVATCERTYPQRALATVVSVRTPHPFTAFERFTPEGPVALLPMGGPRYGLVLCASPDRIHRLGTACETDFLAALDSVFGGRMGGFRAADRRRIFDLKLEYARDIIGRRSVSIGNAAHRLHPVAGQGFNLGLRDAACLSQMVMAARSQGRDGGDRQTLFDYRRWRAPDHARTRRFTDGLVRLFGHRFSPIALMRAPGLVAFDLLPGFKRALTRQATGLAGKVPDLALGIRPTPAPSLEGEDDQDLEGSR